MDFVPDQIFDGRRFQSLTMVDNHSHKCDEFEETIINNDTLKLNRLIGAASVHQVVRQPPIFMATIRHAYAHPSPEPLATDTQNQASFHTVFTGFRDRAGRMLEIQYHRAPDRPIPRRY